MAITYEEINPSPIENATVRQSYRDGVAGSFYINANEGYVLHDNTLDSPVYDEITGEETGNIILGYSEGTKTCRANYDWDANPREFYAVLRDNVPADQIYSGGNNDHEVM